MSRPDFPQPYCILTPEMICRINSDQAEYDRDPEAWERAEKAAEERRQEEERLEREAQEQEYAAMCEAEAAAGAAEQEAMERAMAEQAANEERPF